MIDHTFFMSRDVKFYENVFPFKHIDDIQETILPFPASDIDSSPLSSSNIIHTLEPPSMIRRFARVTKQPTWLADFISHIITSNASTFSTICFTPSHSSYVSNVSKIQELSTFSQASKDANWLASMQLELLALAQNNTWVFIELLKGKKKPIDCK